MSDKLQLVSFFLAVAVSSAFGAIIGSMIGIKGAIDLMMGG